MYRICQVTSATVFWHYTLLGSVIQTFSTFFTGTAGIFFGCLRGRYKAPVPMANAYIFSQFEQKKSQSEGHFFVNQYSLQIAFIFKGLLIKIKHMIRNKSDSMQFKRPCLENTIKMNEEIFPISVKMPKISQSKRP